MLTFCYLAHPPSPTFSQKFIIIQLGHFSYLSFSQIYTLITLYTMYCSTMRIVYHTYTHTHTCLLFHDIFEALHLSIIRESHFIIAENNKFHLTVRHGIRIRFNFVGAVQQMHALFLFPFLFSSVPYQLECGYFIIFFFYVYTQYIYSVY